MYTTPDNTLTPVNNNNITNESDHSELPEPVSIQTALDQNLDFISTQTNDSAITASDIQLAQHAADFIPAQTNEPAITASDAQLAQHTAQLEDNIPSSEHSEQSFRLHYSSSSSIQQPRVNFDIGLSLSSSTPIRDHSPESPESSSTDSNKSVNVESESTPPNSPIQRNVRTSPYPIRGRSRSINRKLNTNRKHIK